MKVHPNIFLIYDFLKILVEVDPFDQTCLGA